jgi:hypothetical protein
MLFHITHRHSEATCPFHDPNIIGETFGKVPGAMKEAGVTVRGSYAHAAAHTVYMVVEADSAEAITAGLAPIIGIGTAVTEPVVESAAIIEERSKK